MQPFELTPEQKIRNERRLILARKLMQIKRETQAEIRASANDPHVKAALEELKRRKTERGTAIVRL